MKVELKGCLASLLSPAIEMSVKEKRKEYFGYLYGYTINNGKTSTKIITRALTLSTQRATEMRVGEPTLRVAAVFNYNIETILDRHEKIMGDYHIHNGDKIDTKKYEQNSAYMRDLTKCSEADKEKMTANGHIYLILGCCENETQQKKTFIRNNNRSVMIQLHDYTFCISGWLYTQKNKISKTTIEITRTRN